MRERSGVHCVLFDIVKSGKLPKYPLEKSKNGRRQWEWWFVRCGGGARGGRRKCVCLCESMCLFLGHEKANPSTYYSTDWSIMLGEISQSKKDKCCVTPLIPPTCKSEVAKFIDAKGRKPFRGSRGMWSSVDAEFQSCETKTSVWSLLHAHSHIMLYTWDLQE